MKDGAWVGCPRAFLSLMVGTTANRGCGTILLVVLTLGLMVLLGVLR
jgi:hypothetical protein